MQLRTLKLGANLSTHMKITRRSKDFPNVIAVFTDGKKGYDSLLRNFLSKIPILPAKAW